MDKLYMPEDHMEHLYNSRNPLVRFVHRSRLKKIMKIVKDKNGKLLDAGCGEGHLLSEISKTNKKLRLYGVDVTSIAVKKAKKRISNAIIRLGNLSELGSLFEESYFDIVICSEVLEHISQYKGVIQNLERVSKKDGLIIISFPNENVVTLGRWLLGVNPAKAPDHVNSFTPEELIKEFKAKYLCKENYPLNLPFSLMVGTIIRFKK